ncbi:MAG: hypothetical protein Q8Q20_02355 [bacterium]|nr:hypothetical protein [bacterium]
MPDAIHENGGVAVPARKRHRLRVTLIVGIVVLILLPLGLLGWTGLYNIPVISALFGTNKPIDLGVHPTEADLASAKADNPMTVSAETGEFRWTRNKSFSGSVPIDDVHTSEEVTAFITAYHGDGGNVRDIQVKFRPGGMEISAFVVPYVKAPAYVNIDVARTSANSVSLNLQSAKLGRLTVPERYYDEIEDAAERILNREIASVNGFSIEELIYGDNTATLRGTLPETVNLEPGEQDLESLLE